MMSEPTAQAAAKRKLHMPDTWLVVFAIVAVMAALSWVIPSGSFDYQKVDVNGTMRSVAVAGSYHAIPKAQTKPTSSAFSPRSIRAATRPPTSSSSSSPAQPRSASWSRPARSTPASARS